ncbi:MAG: DUF2177 family protein [Phenylobacterium sp.]|uniref:DUF2177 family protein n=1 Tax=Phenylobacterium sp. TaxID=1871053 RepID=UPI002732EE49|nr:DUF2177 family protein [Phenylobacterium sp.]MDP3175008.1 DUF2177 family protein [Phenylobacterium sp.]
MPYIAAYLAAAVTFVLLDAVWLTLAGPKLYKPIIGEILAERVAAGPAVAFYLIYLVGVVVLAAAPAAREGSWPRAMALGATLGVVAYATYDLTNQATLKVWSLKITLADMAWGAFVTAMAATASCLAFRAVRRAFG